MRQEEEDETEDEEEMEEEEEEVLFDFIYLKKRRFGVLKVEFSSDNSVVHKAKKCR